MNIRNTISILTACCLLLISPSIQAQITSTGIDSLVQQALIKFNVAGAAVAVVKDGKVVHKSGYGVKSVATKVPVDVFTNFEIASNSKAFTCTALSMLVEEGKLSWTDKVKTYIPEFRMYNEYVTEHFTIEDLLIHRSGLGLGAGDLMIFPDGSNFTIKDIITNFQHFKPVSAFRTKYDYDNQLYLIAGEVIARISGMTWEAFIQKHIMTPLKMNHSAPALSLVKDKTTLSAAHSDDSGQLRTIPLFEDMVNGSAAGIMSNVNDMAKWMVVHLNKGQYGKDKELRLFSEASQQNMWSIHTPQTNRPNPRYNNHFAGYGLGFVLSDVKGNLKVSHTGGMPGMLSQVTMIPDIGLGVVVLTNTEGGGSPLFASVSQTIVDSYLGLDDNDWMGKYAASSSARRKKADSVVSKVWETVAAANQAAVNKENFIGIYEDKWFGKMEVFLKNDQLWIRSHRSPKLNGRMQFYKANTFVVKWAYQDMNADAFAIFSLDEEGKAQGLKIKGISPAIDFSFDFQDLDFSRVQTKGK